MTEIFAADGKRMPVTLVEAGPCQVIQLKNKESDGYVAVQLGYEEIAAKKIKKSQTKKPYVNIRECRMTESDTALNLGDKIDVTIFKEGDIVKVANLRWGVRRRLSTFLP